MACTLGGLMGEGECGCRGGRGEGVTHKSSIATGGVFGGIDPSRFSVSGERKNSPR